LKIGSPEKTSFPGIWVYILLDKIHRLAIYSPQVIRPCVQRFREFYHKTTKERNHEKNLVAGICRALFPPTATWLLTFLRKRAISPE
jgi:hypothetical protein